MRLKSLHWRRQDFEWEYMTYIFAADQIFVSDDCSGTVKGETKTGCLDGGSFLPKSGRIQCEG